MKTVSEQVDFKLHFNREGERMAGGEQSVNMRRCFGMKSMRKESDAETRAHCQSLREMEERLAEISPEVRTRERFRSWSAMSPRIALNISSVHETIMRPDAGINPVRAE
jgi:hypothetical protein